MEVHPQVESLAQRASSRRIASVFAVLQFAIHAVVNARGGYGIFRDEYYYIACSERLAAGYVDLPPLSAFLLALQRAVFGDSVFALRLFPALAGAAVVYGTGRLASRLGAVRGGVGLACLACLCSPITLALTGIYSMNAFDLLIWIAAAHVLLDARSAPRARHWILLGVLCGLGLLNKISAAWLLLGILVGLFATPARRELTRPMPYVAAAIALLLFLPFVLWNATHGWAHLEFIRGASEGKYSGLSAWTFLAGQFELQHPLNAPIWIAGLWFLMLARRGAAFRALGWIVVTTALVLVLNGHSKSEYLSVAFPILYAAGGAAVDLVRARWFARILRPLHAALLAGTAVMFAPFAVPILPVDSFIAWSARLGVGPSTNEGKELARLPQFYADMFGWEAQVDAVARAYARLDGPAREDCAIFASNYGRCGAIDFLGDSRGLPDSIGSHNNYWIWGPRESTGRTMLILAADLGDRAEWFDSVEVAEQVVPDPYAMPYESGLKVFLCRGLKRPLAEVWPELRHYD